MTPRLVSVGNVVVDLLLRLVDLPSPGEDVTALSSGVSAGGSFNALVAASRQGVRAAYAGAHGTGPFGDMVRNALAREGIELLHPQVADIDTGWDVAITDSSGERTFVSTVGAEAHIESDALARLDLATGDVVHVSGYSFARQPSLGVLTDWVPTIPAGVVVIVDPGPLGEAIPASVKARADWWSSARGEAAGDPQRDWIVRLGADGCQIGDVRVPGFSVEAIDTNGAGDTHVGVFAASIALGLDPITAASRANAAAAIAVTRIGPATGPTSQDLDAFIATHLAN